MVRNVVKTTKPETTSDNYDQDTADRLGASRWNVKNVSKISGPQRSKESVRIRSRATNKLQTLSEVKSSRIESVQAAAVKTQRVAKVAPKIVSVSTVPYTFQVVFGIICLIGAGILSGLDNSGLMSAADFVTFGSATDVGGGLFLVGAIGSMLCGLIIAALATVPLKTAGAHPIGGLSIMILAICTGLHLVPVLNIFPIMGAWCLYVALAD